MSISTETSGLIPLRRFKGVCQSIEEDVRKGDRGEYTVIVFKFTDVDPIESVTPFPFPTCEIQISHSDRTETRWAAMGDSIRRLLGPDEGADAMVLQGKKQEWAMLPSPTRRPEDPQNPGGNWVTEDTPCWQAVAVEGAAEAAENLTERLLDLADGKTDTQFNQAALADPQVTASPTTVTSITGRTLLPALIEAKQLSRDSEGVLHKAGG